MAISWCLIGNFLHSWALAATGSDIRAWDGGFLGTEVKKFLLPIVCSCGPRECAAHDTPSCTGFLSNRAVCVLIIQEHFSRAGRGRYLRSTDCYPSTFFDPLAS